MINDWLKKLDLEAYLDAFTKEAIDVDVLPQLTEDDLVKLGVSVLGHRKKMLAAITALRAAQTSPAPSSAAAEAAVATPAKSAENAESWLQKAIVESSQASLANPRTVAIMECIRQALVASPSEQLEQYRERAGVELGKHCAKLHSAAQAHCVQFSRPVKNLISDGAHNTAQERELFSRMSEVLKGFDRAIDLAPNRKDVLAAALAATDFGGYEAVLGSVVGGLNAITGQTTVVHNHSSLKGGWGGSKDNEFTQRRARWAASYKALELREAEAAAKARHVADVNALSAAHHAGDRRTALSILARRCRLSMFHARQVLDSQGATMDAAGAEAVLRTAPGEGEFFRFPPDALRAAAEQWSTPDKTWTVGDKIPPKKLVNAHASFPIPRDAQVVALFDATVFGSAQEGFALTPDGIFCSTPSKQQRPLVNFVPWDAIAGASKMTHAEPLVLLGESAALFVDVQLSAAKKPGSFVSMLERMRDYVLDVCAKPGDFARIEARKAAAGDFTSGPGGSAPAPTTDASASLVEGPGAPAVGAGTSDPSRNQMRDRASPETAKLSPAALLELCKTCDHPSMKIAGPSSEKRFAVARAAFPIPASSEIVALFDTTLMGSGKEGWAVCDDGLYVKADGKQSVQPISWSVLATATIGEKGGIHGGVDIDGKWVLRVAAFTKKVLPIVEKIQGLTRDRPT